MALRRAALILCTALAAPLLGATAAHADPSTPLSGFGDFSGSQTQVVFDGLGLMNGDDVASVGGVDFALSAGTPAKFYEDPFARESGIGDIGSVGNFWGFMRPYPDLGMRFAGRMHRVGFEARVNTADQIVVTLLSGGATVDQQVLPSRGADALYFYGFENLAGFDAVEVHIANNASSAFTLDNLTFENVDAPAPPPDDEPEPDPDPEPDPEPEPEPEPDLPELACDGFQSFPPLRPGRARHDLPLRALMATVASADGHQLKGSEMSAPPVLRVMFAPDSGDVASDVTDEVSWQSSEFAFAGGRVQRWFVWLLPGKMRAAGTYLATMESGDPAAYTIDPTCADWTLNERKPRPHRHDRHCRHDRHDRHHRD